MAIKISLGIDKAQQNNKLFYASRIIKPNPNEKINLQCNFSYLSCAHIILSGGPSSVPAFFLFKGWTISFLRIFREYRALTILEVKNLRNVKPLTRQIRLTLKLTRPQGSESFIARKHYWVFWVSNICSLGFPSVGLLIMGGGSDLLHFTFWPGVKRPHQTK